MKIKLLAMLLALLACLLPLSACKGKGSGDETRETIELDTSDGYDYGSLDYKGEDFTFLQCDENRWGMKTALAPEAGETGDEVSDAVYSRNVKVETLYNVVIKCINRDIYETGEYVRTQCFGGDSTVDAAYVLGSSVATLIGEGLLNDFSEMNEVQIYEPWWGQKIREASQFGGSSTMYYAQSDISVTAFELTWCVAVNLDRISTLDMENPYHTGMLAGKYFYRRMGAALANCGRDIVFSACSWGMEETQEWVKTTGAHLWRSTHDIQNSWASIKSIIEQQARLIPYVSRGCFNDMDMLVVGMNSDSFIDSERGTNGCTLTEQRTHFSAWCLFASPLMIGCDLRRASPEALEILKNKEALAINQDSACNQVYRIALDRGPDEMPVFVRLLENGDFAVGVFNMGEGAYRFVFGLDEMGVSPESGRVLIPREVWSGESPVLHNGVFDVTVEPHGCRLYRCRLAKQA